MIRTRISSTIIGQTHLNAFPSENEDFSPPLTPPQGGEQEKGSDFERNALKITAKKFFSPFPMRSSGKGAGGKGFLSANASINLDAIALAFERIHIVDHDRLMVNSHHSKRKRTVSSHFHILPVASCKLNIIQW